MKADKTKKPKLSLREMIFNWLVENDHVIMESPKDIKQTNISFRKHSYRAQYYFSANSWISSYTMKRWVEIAYGNEYDSFKTDQGDWFWLKDGKVIN